MADLEAADPADSGSSSPTRQGRGRRRRPLTGRTMAICVCVALVGALIAGLVAATVLQGDDDGSDPNALDVVDPVDYDQLVSVPLTALDGSATTLSQLLDQRPAVVNIWAQSCVPCVEEMPLLEQASRDNPDVAFLGVDTQDQLEAAEAMATQTGITYPWVQDPSGNFFYEARGAGMPTTLLLSPSGRVLATKTGAFKTGSQLQTWIDENRS